MSCGLCEAQPLICDQADTVASEMYNINDSSSLTIPLFWDFSHHNGAFPDCSFRSADVQIPIETLEACSSLDNNNNWIPELTQSQELYTGDSLCNESRHLRIPANFGGVIHSVCTDGFEFREQNLCRDVYSGLPWQNLYDDSCLVPEEYLYYPQGEFLHGNFDSGRKPQSFDECLETVKTRLKVTPTSKLITNVGRPRKNKTLNNLGLGKSTCRLWEFIRDLLRNPDYCPSLIRWENLDEGEFRIIHGEEVAQLWGQFKGNSRMTYAKLSRAMRYLYKTRKLEPVLGRRLFKFGCNAVDWRPVNPNLQHKMQS